MMHLNNGQELARNESCISAKCTQEHAQDNNNKSKLIVKKYMKVHKV